MKYILLAGIALGLILGTFVVQFSRQNIDSPATTDRYRQSFVESCSASGRSSEAFCDCTYGELSENHSVAEITDMGLEAQATNKLPDPMMDAMIMCADKL